MNYKGTPENLILWKPGQSGNPNGRPKKVKVVADLAEENSDKAIRKLARLIDSEDERVALAAAQAILDRAIGKPKQTVETTTKTEASDYTRAELLAIARVGSARASSQGHGSGEPDRVLTLHAQELPPGDTSRDDRGEVGSGREG